MYKALGELSCQCFYETSTGVKQYKMKYKTLIEQLKSYKDMATLLSITGFLHWIVEIHYNMDFLLKQQNRNIESKVI